MTILPPFYDPSRVGQLYIPDTATAISTGLATNMSAADNDSLRVLLLLVDMQVDFIHTDGALSVPGAVEDARRTIEWIYENTPTLTTIAASLDSHLPVQIFYASWWIDANGNPPTPYTEITAADVEQGIWKPRYEIAWSHEYVHKLADQARKNLMIWPYHTMIGTPGHGLTPALYEAIAYHSAARQTEPIFLTKGSIPKTEHYSMLEPEVKVSDNPQGTINRSFLDMIASYDVIYVAGQAKSHCVLETVTSMMRYFNTDIISKLHVLYDAMSSVAHPQIDFDAAANKAFETFAKEGLNIVYTTD